MTKYDEKSIERFAGLSGIRKKPTPYIGPTDSNGLWTCWREPADNCVDQALAGRNDLVHLILDPNKVGYWVLDAGEGIPVGKKVFENERGKKEELSTFYVVTGLTHGGSNFKGDTVSRGTHGIGIKATNAMSKVFKVWTCRNNQWYCIEYKDAKLSKDVYKSKAPVLPHKIKITKGTAVYFEPDTSLFRKGSVMDPQFVKDWCELTAYLVPKMRVRFTDAKGKTRELRTKGPGDYINKVLEEKKLIQTGKMFTYSSKELDVAVSFTDAEGDDLVKAYTNGLYNKEGGEHVLALTDALAKSLKSFSRTDNKGKLKYKPSDLRDGLIGLVNFKLAAPQFNNQPKDKLVDERVYPLGYPQLVDAWSKFWKLHPSMAKQIVARAEILRSKTADFLKDKKLIKNVNSARKSIATKLAPVVGNSPVEKRELFIVEGDSAGGGLKRARDKSYQAVYPMRGKPLNVMDAKKDKINNNAEIVGLLAGLGVDLTGKKSNGAIQYGKIVSMADPDVDGKHIVCLTLCALWKYMPHLFKQGIVHVVKAPLYKGTYKGKVYFGMSKDELFKKVGTNKCDVTYVKGWGEINEEDLSVAIDPKVRTLYKVLPPDKKDAKEFELLLGKQSAYRKKLLNVE